MKISLNPKLQKFDFGFLKVDSCVAFGPDVLVLENEDSLRCFDYDCFSCFLLSCI